jgi:cell division protein FtsA
MLGRKNKEEFSIGIDIGTHTSRVVAVRKNDENSLPEIIAVAACESHGMRSGYVTHVSAAKETLDSLCKQMKDQSGIEIKKAFVSIGGISVTSVIASGDTVISRADGIISQIDIERSIEEAKKKIDLTNREILHIIPINYKIDGKDVLGRPLGMRGSKVQTQVFFVIVLSQHLTDLIDLFTKSGIEIENIVASPIAASQIALTENQKQHGTMLANIGAETVSVIVYDRGLPLSLQVFPIGGSDFTKDIALGLKIPIEEAEQIKMGRLQGAHSERKLSEIIEARLRDVFEIIEKHLKKINRDALLPAGIIITGGGSHISQIESLARSALRLPCRIGIPEHLLQMKPRIRDVSWIVAYGLATYKKEDVNINSKSATNHTSISKKIKSFLHDLMP